MYQLLFYVLLPWTTIAASPKSDEYKSNQRKEPGQFFGAGRPAKKQDAAPSATGKPESLVRAAVQIDSNGETQKMELSQDLGEPEKKADTPPAIRKEGGSPNFPPPQEKAPGIPLTVTEEDDSIAEVPKILHFMYKEDLSARGKEWPNPVWKVSWEAWQKHFPQPEYMYRFWTDNTIDRLFKDSCSKHYTLFTTYTKEIFKSDLSRYCILREIGGIYADLDYEPRTNFYDDLKPGHVSLIQSAYDHEDFQNALMASPQGGKFTDYWSGLLDLAELKRSFNEGPVEATGPKLLDAYPPNEDEELVNTLKCQHFGRKVHHDRGLIKKNCGFMEAGKDLKDLQDPRKIKGIHWGTVSWNGLHGDLALTEGQNNHKDTANLFRLIHPEVVKEAEKRAEKTKLNEEVDLDLPVVENAVENENKVSQS